MMDTAPGVLWIEIFVRQMEEKGLVQLDELGDLLADGEKNLLITLTPKGRIFLESG